MLKGPEFGEAIARAIQLKKDRGTISSQKEVADHFKIKPPSLIAWIKRGTVSKDKLPELWRYFSEVAGPGHWGMTPAEWPSGLPLEIGSNATFTPPSGLSGNTEPGPDLHGLVPLISWVQAGSWTAVVDNLQPGQAYDWLACPVAHGPHTFVLRVRGESMLNPHGRPSFADGDLIYVDPEREAVHGSLVVVRIDGNMEATFKKLVIEGEQKYLRPLNPAWPEQIIRINGNATICGIVIFKGETI